VLVLTLSMWCWFLALTVHAQNNNGPPSQPPPSPSSPSSPPSPSLPPPSPPPGTGTVVLTLTASGSIGDYSDTSSLQQNVATAAGIDRSLVVISVAAASVRITATLAVPASTTAASVQNSLSSSLGTADDATAALGVTVESVPTVEVASPLPQLPPPTGPPPPPPPPPPPLPRSIDVGGLSTGVVIGTVLGIIVGVCLISVAILRWVNGHCESEEESDEVRGAENGSLGRGWSRDKHGPGARV